MLEYDTEQMYEKYEKNVVLMKSLIFRCKHCDQYTLSMVCPNCQNRTINPAPPRFSPEDKYGKYRRKLKMELNAKE